MYDGSDWRAATEEGDFVSSPSSSSSFGSSSSPSSTQEQLVHPFHKNGMFSKSMPTMGCHYEQSNIFEPLSYASDRGEDNNDEDDAFETGIFTME